MLSNTENSRTASGKTRIRELEGLWRHGEREPITGSGPGSDSEPVVGSSRGTVAKLVPRTIEDAGVNSTELKMTVAATPFCRRINAVGQLVRR